MRLSRIIIVVSLATIAAVAAVRTQPTILRDQGVGAALAAAGEDALRAVRARVGEKTIRSFLDGIGDRKLRAALARFFLEAPPEVAKNDRATRSGRRDPAAKDETARTAARPQPPGTLPEIAPGHWYEIPNSHLRAVAPKAGPIPARFKDRDYHRRLAGLMLEYNGGGYDTKRDCLMVWGGGRVSYTGNEVYRFCLGTLRWERVTEPSSFDAVANGRAWRDGDVKMPDGTPVTAHTFDGIAYLPNVDKFLVFGAFTFESGKSAAEWLFDPAARTWTRLDLKDDNLISVYDPVTGHVFLRNNHRMVEFDPVAGTSITRVSGSWNWPHHRTAAIDPVRHLLVAVGEGQVLAYDLKNPKTRWDDDTTERLTSGDTDGIAGNGPGFEWDPKIDKFVAWKGGGDVYTLDPTTWVWTKIPPAPGNAVVPPEGDPNGTYGRFRYIPSKDLFIVVDSVDEDVYLYRLDNARGAKPTMMPAPNIALTTSDAVVETGHGITLSWNTTNAESCMASGAWSGKKPLSGSIDTLPIRDSRAFTLTCIGQGGTSRKTLDIKVPTIAEMKDGVLHVCPPGPLTPDCEYQSLGRAAKAVRPGETILLAPGVYRQCATIRTSGVTIKGKGAHLERSVCGEKGALVWDGDNGTVEDLECSGVTVADRNGACVRIEGDAKTMTIRNVYFHDNDTGILGGVEGGHILIENSRFEHGGLGGFAHGIYILTPAEVVIRNSSFIGQRSEGHEIKSRAERTVLENNVIAGLDENDSRAIDIPNGGELVIRGNVIEKGPKADNADMIGIAREIKRHSNRRHSTLVEDNLFIFDRPGVVFTSESPGKIVFRNNRVVGHAKVGAPAEEQGNTFLPDRAAAGLPPFPALPPAPK